MATKHFVCEAQELPPGSRKLIQIGKKSVGVFNVDGSYYALLNLCPHQFAPLCKGRITGYSPPSAVGEYRFERQGEIIRCPWHGWEFDIKTGRSIFNPHQVRTASYPVRMDPPEEAGAHNCETEATVETFPVKVENHRLFVEL